MEMNKLRNKLLLVNINDKSVNLKNKNISVCVVLNENQSFKMISLSKGILEPKKVVTICKCM